jgi:hypothetical protein
MKERTRFVGLDVHADTIAVAVAENGRRGEVRYLGRIPNDATSVSKLVRKLGPAKTLRVCYEAGPTGGASSGDYGDRVEGPAAPVSPLRPLGPKRERAAQGDYRCGT